MCTPPLAVQITKEEYGEYGSEALGERLAEQLRAEGKNPYVVPVGGSSPLGGWWWWGDVGCPWGWGVSGPGAGQQPAGWRGGWAVGGLRCRLELQIHKFVCMHACFTRWW